MLWGPGKGLKLALTTLPDELSGAGTISRALRPVLRRPPYAAHLAPANDTRGSTTSELLALVLASGLELVELQLTPTLSRHESGAAFVEFAEASAFGNLLGLVPQSLRDTLRAEVVAAFDALSGPDGVSVHGWEAQLVARRV